MITLCAVSEGLMVEVCVIKLLIISKHMHLSKIPFSPFECVCFHIVFNLFLLLLFLLLRLYTDPILVFLFNQFLHSFRMIFFTLSALINTERLGTSIKWNAGKKKLLLTTTLIV